MTNNDFDNQFQSFTKTRWVWNEVTDEWQQVTETFGRVVTGEWWRDEDGRWNGWNTQFTFGRDENDNFVTAFG